MRGIMFLKFKYPKIIIKYAALCLLLVQFTFAQTATPTAEEISAKAEEYMRASTKLEKFSGTILVAKDGKPIISKGYGMANYEFDIPNQSNSIFRLGSITKQFTGVAIMQLQEKGKLNVNDLICKYLEDCPTAWAEITIKNMLTHTSGIPNYTDFDNFQKTASEPIKSIELLAHFKDKPLDFKPNENYKYSNSAYHLLGVIIEKVSGKTYADYLQEHIFTPLGMKDSGYDVSSKILKNRAAGYRLINGEFANANYLNMEIPYSAGSLYSTVGDLLIWDQALYTEKVLSKKSLEEMFTPFKANYGYGWIISKTFDRTRIAHSGGIFGFNTQFSRFPDDKVTIVVLSNNQNFNAGKVAHVLSAIVFGEDYKLPQEAKTVSPEILQKYVGEYQLAPTFLIKVTLEEGNLMVEPSGQGKTQIFAESETKFFLRTVDAQITFNKDAGGKITSLTLHQGGRDTTGTKNK